MPTTQAPPRPILCCRPMRAPDTCRLSAWLRSCQQSSAHWANPIRQRGHKRCLLKGKNKELQPVAPNGWPLEIKPPLGLTTYLPPYVLSPLSTISPALPVLEIRFKTSFSITEWQSTFITEAKSFVGDQLICREAIYQGKWSFQRIVGSTMREQRWSTKGSDFDHWKLTASLWIDRRFSQWYPHSSEPLSSNERNADNSMVDIFD